MIDFLAGEGRATVTIRQATTLSSVVAYWRVTFADNGPTVCTHRVGQYCAVSWGYVINPPGKTLHKPRPGQQPSLYSPATPPN